MRRLSDHQGLENSRSTGRARPSFAALRRSELAALAVDQITEHDKGLVLTLTRSTTNQCGDQTELVVVPKGATKPLSGYGSSHLAGRCGGSVTDRCFVQSARATEHYLAA
jgi:hypothetical protein